jgi:ribosomal protein S14
LDRAEYVEDGAATSTTSTRSFGTALADAVIVSVTSGAERRRLLLMRIDWATRDPTYRDMLDFFTEAKGAANPRPALTSLWERLEAKCGNEDAVKRQLSISRAELRAIKGDQSRYEGDRHATYAPGAQPARIDEKARHAALAIGRKLISVYEKQEFGANGLPV